MGVGQRSIRKNTKEWQECGPIAYMRIRCRQEHDVSNNSQWRAEDHKHATARYFPTPEACQCASYRPDKIGWDSQKLLVASSLVRKDCFDNGWKKERKTVHRDTVE